MLVVTLEIVSGPLPLLVTVTVRGSPEVPTYWAGKVRLEGEKPTVEGGTPPTPVKPTV